MKVNTIYKRTLCSIRSDKGYSIKDAAMMIGVSVTDLEEFERNPAETPINIAAKIALIYDVPSHHISWT